eukprot:46711-Eustigmatos_ZCMA.PRE.1
MMCMRLVGAPFRCYGSACRSVDLDEWTPQQLLTMKLGGNLNARQFFRKHGITPDVKVGRRSRSGSRTQSHTKAGAEYQ